MKSMLRYPCMALILTCVSCAEQKPRSLEEIRAEQQNLPTLYLTKTGERVVAPGSKGVVVCDETKEIALPAYQCNNPDCPGRSEDGEPVLFSIPDPRFYVTVEGEVGEHSFDSPEVMNFSGSYELECPKCLASRNKSAETPEQSQQYLRWCQPYELPESAKRREELEEEHKARVDYINRRIGETD